MIPAMLAVQQERHVEENEVRRLQVVAAEWLLEPNELVEEAEDSGDHAKQFQCEHQHEEAL
jgi:hypothetical protein